jgi:hypothetical protein
MITKLEYKNPHSFLWVSEEEINATDTCNVLLPNGSISFATPITQFIKGNKKIIAQTNITPEIPNIPIIELPEEEDVEKLAVDYLFGEYEKQFLIETNDTQNGVIQGFIAGYRASSKEKMFSKEQVLRYHDISCIDGYIEANKYLKSLTPKSNFDIIGCELVMEELHLMEEAGGYIKKPKTYINKSGKTCLSVKFIYK